MGGCPAEAEFRVHIHMLQSGGAWCGRHPVQWPERRPEGRSVPNSERRPAQASRANADPFLRRAGIVDYDFFGVERVYFQNNF